jgi:hypothetical protein
MIANDMGIGQYQIIFDDAARSGTTPGSLHTPGIIIIRRIANDIYFYNGFSDILNLSEYRRCNKK